MTLSFVPNYMFWIGVTHNSIGRFYETQSFRGQNHAQTQGNFFLAFNAILNWDHLDAGRAAPLAMTAPAR